ncbi:MAG: hypothetical protein J6M30_08075 [Bacteroidales bacterium]|nr:hypothetical protein [Bacteroidales bacterium]
MKKFLITLLISLPFVTMGQGNSFAESVLAGSDSGDTSVVAPYFSAAAGWTFPFGEMGNRYSSFMNLNADLGVKTLTNWIIYLDFAFQFGSNNIKHMDDYLAAMMSDGSNPFVIGSDGTDAGVVGYNRNLSLSLGIGKIIRLPFSNINSGMEVSLQGGYLQHQIIYQSTQTKVEQLEGDYAYGYDRQMRGPMAGMFIGYRHISKKSYANWFAGVQYSLAFTKMTRKYQFDLMSGDNKRYTDRMLTFKVGWMFPFFKRAADKIYYF